MTRASAGRFKFAYRACVGHTRQLKFEYLGGSWPSPSSQRHYASATPVTDAQRGVTDRFRSMPMAPSAVLVGRAAADMVISTIGLATLLLAGLAVGWRATGGFGVAVAAVGLLLLLRFALLWVGIYLGLLVRNAGGWGAGSWIAQHAVPMAVIWPLVIVAVFAPLSVRRYREMSR